jgi:lactate permease
MAALSQFIVEFTIRDTGASPFAANRSAAWMLIVMAPIAGALGSFAAGSATVSNLLFGATLFRLVELFALPSSLILALQVVGAGAGNMVSLQNLAAVQATVGLVNREREMLRSLWLPCILYIIIAALLGLVLAKLEF